MANAAQFRAVLDDMTKQKAQLERRLVEVSAAISALMAFTPTASEPASTSSPGRAVLPVLRGDGKYAGMGVRWGVLNFLAEDAQGPVPTAQVASALQAGGITTKGKNFTANVSAVLSDMSRNKEEVALSAGSWELTDKGRSAWEFAKAARERHRMAEPLTEVLESPAEPHSGIEQITKR